MKIKELILFLIGSVLVIYAMALSLIDEVYALPHRDNNAWLMYDRKWLLEIPSPEGFSISPKEAVMIYNRFVCGAWNRLGSYCGTLYADQDSYYFMGDSSCRLTAKLFGTRIHGRTAQVWNPMKIRWEQKGYINIPYCSFSKIVTNGMCKAELNKIMGSPYTKNYVADAAWSYFGPETDERNVRSRFKTYSYWCIDGEIDVVLESNQVLHVEEAFRPRM